MLTRGVGKGDIRDARLSVEQRTQFTVDWRRLSPSIAKHPHSRTTQSPCAHSDSARVEVVGEVQGDKFVATSVNLSE